MVLLRTASRPARSSGSASRNAAATPTPMREHQRAASPVTGHHQPERRDDDQPDQQDRPLPAEHLAGELSSASLRRFASASCHARRRSSAGTPASAGRRRPGSATRDRRRPTRRGARRRPACRRRRGSPRRRPRPRPGRTMSRGHHVRHPGGGDDDVGLAGQRGRSRVPVWHNVTVAFSDRRVSSSPSGLPDRHAASDHHDVRARDLALRSGAADARCRAACTAAARAR